MKLTAFAFLFALFTGACAAEDIDAPLVDDPVAADSQDVAFPTCGDRICGSGTYCCNSSCGWCVPKGNLCPLVVCEQDDPTATDVPGDTSH